MRITLTLAQLESAYLHDEKAKPIRADVWALLYMAARSGGVDVIDALNCLRRDKDERVTDDDVIYAKTE